MENIYHLFYKFISYNLFAFITIKLFDKIIIYFDKRGRWFQLHFIVNMCISCLTIEDVVDCLMNPQASNELSRYYGGATLAFMLHVYHTLYFSLNSIDVYHHVLSCFICTPMCLSYPCKGLSIYLFFATGLPGGIDYLLLSFVKNNKMSRMTEKNINSYLNTYIRIPGGVIGSYLTFKDGLQQENLTRAIGNYLLAYIIFLNCTFFGKLSIENYIEHKYIHDKSIKNFSKN